MLSDYRAITETYLGNKILRLFNDFDEYIEKLPKELNFFEVVIDLGKKSFYENQHHYLTGSQ
jgi:hypothetical protein